MKKLILAVALVALLAPAAMADDSLDQYIELLRSDMKTQTVAVITEVMDFSKEEGDAFWPVYREFELERMGIGDKRLQLIKDYAEAYEMMTDEKANELINRSFKISESREKLAKKYFKKVEKVTSSITAAKWAMLMHQIDLLIDVQIAAEVPLIARPMQ